MRWRQIVTIIGGLCFVGVLLVGFSLRRQWLQSTTIKREREWVWLNARQLAAAGPPSAELQSGAITGRWVQQDYLLFSNGWAGYRIHTMHACDGMGDMALLRTDNGILYLSKLHYCCGIEGWMAPPRDDPPRPENAKDFLSGRGKYQEWNRLSPDGRVVCVIRSLDGERVRQKNQVRVWIGRIVGPSQATLLDEHYQIIGYGIGWSTHWISNERVEVEFYNYHDRSLSSVLDSEENVPSNHIATFAFHLDHNSGKFADKE